MLEQEKIRELVANHLAQKKIETPHFSMRSLALKWGVSPSKLSEFLSGKVHLGEKTLNKILLHFPEKERSAALKTKKNYKLLQHQRLSSLVSDIHSFALLSFLETPRGKVLLKKCLDKTSLSQALADVFDLEYKKIYSLIEQLINFCFLKFNHDLGWLVSLNVADIEGFDLQQALRLSHQQSLILASMALQKTPVALRDFSSLTFRFSPENIDDLRKDIAAFQQQIDEKYEQQHSSHVYLLNVNVFPISK
jgi:lambda repressor-like predicted transcriptional regulator